MLKVIFGVLLIMAGSIFALDQLGFPVMMGLERGEVVSLTWGVILLVVCATLLYKKHWIIGFFFGFWGIASIIPVFSDYSIWPLFFPVLLIVVGLQIIFGFGVFNNKITDSSKDINDVVLFSGIEKKVTSKEFKEGEIICAFGGGQLDMREAVLNKDGAKLSIVCAFGGVDLIVPEDMKVKVTGIPVFGGWSNKTSNTEGKAGPTLEIDAVVAFGGFEIKNHE